MSKRRLQGRALFIASWRARALALAVLCSAAPALLAADAAPPGERALWARTMGQSGLRRFYSTGADLGELINRQVSYQIASRVESAALARKPAASPPVASSDVEGFVAQYDALMG